MITASIDTTEVMTWNKNIPFLKGQRVSINNKVYQVIIDDYISGGSIDLDLSRNKIILLASGEELGKLSELKENVQKQINTIGIQGVFSAQNKDTVAIKKGMPVATHSSGTGVVKAIAVNNSKPCIALAKEKVVNTFSGEYVTDGIFTMSDWTDVTGTVLLEAKAIYFLSTDAGKITTLSPSVSGMISQEIGRAVSTKEMEITIKQSILL